MPAPKPITVVLTPAEAAALLKTAETGLAVMEALNMIVSTATMKAAIGKVRAAMPAR
jgi:hypothetical protein